MALLPLPVPEGCTPTTAPVSDTCGGGVDTNATGTTNVACPLPVSDTCDGGVDTNATGTTNVACPLPVSDTCGDGVDNNVTGTINGTTNVVCPLPVSDTCGDGVDNNVTGTINCPILEPTVVIDSAVDEVGNALSPGDVISPQKVTFTFSTQANETIQNLEEEGPNDYEFECAVDDASFNSCSSPMTYAIEEGKHDFVVRLVP